MSAACPRVAALDLGTNTFLALVAELDGSGELHVVEDVFRTPRLGEGLARTGRMSEEGMRRAIDALQEFMRLLARHSLDPHCVRAVGTAVFRRAANAAEFVERVRAECGLSIEIVSGELEGELSFAAASAGLVGRGDDLSVIDVGGGSTELAWAGGSARVSVPIGAVVLTEAHLGGRTGDPWADAEWNAALGELRSGLSSALAAGPSRPEGRGVVVALGGSAANLAALEAGFDAFDPARTEGLVVRAAAAWRFADRLRRLDVDARRRCAIEFDRAAILPAGLACLGAALDALGAECARASGRGLRYGLAWKTLLSRRG